MARSRAYRFIQYSPFYTKVISRVRDSTHVLDGLLYHESDLEITFFGSLVTEEDTKEMSYRNMQKSTHKNGK
ncbi:transposase [Escherichia coli]|nr:transposase [Escherichia coli]